MKQVLVIFSLVITLRGALCFAGAHEEGLEAYKKGDYKTAFTTWTAAANKGDAAAQYDLGVMYAKGEGVAQDYKQAVLLTRKAADQGYAPAQINLGVAYANGQGVAKNSVEAYKWLTVAAEQTIDKQIQELAIKGRDAVAKQMTETQIEAGQKLAKEWKKK
jgi:TPR repeat protein